MASLRSPVALSSQYPPNELEKARAEVQRARADMAAAQDRADQAKAKLQQATRDAKVRLRWTAVIMMTAALLKVGWEAAMRQSPVTSSEIVQPMAESSGAMAVQSGAPTEAQVALERLHDAFYAFPDEDQPAVVKEVNARYAGSEFTCPLAWSEGVPALSVKDRGKAEPMMAGALNRCAAGVERLRRERDADYAKLTK